MAGRPSAFHAHLTLGISLTVGSLAAAACGSSGSHSISNPGGPDGSGGVASFDGGGGLIGPGSSSGGGTNDGGGSTLSNVQIVPADASITVQAGGTATQAYKVMGVLNGTGAPVDVTDHSSSGFPTTT
jgi:hypothetical protein